MTPGRFGDPVADPAAALARCGDRDTNLEGIEMYLVLEDGEGRPLVRDDDGDGPELAAIAARYVDAIAADPANPTEFELGCALEVLASHHFEPGGDAT